MTDDREGVATPGAPPSHAATGTDADIRVAASADVTELERDVRTGRRRRGGRIVVALEGMDEAARARSEDEINHAYFACGCGTATVVGLLGLAGFAIWWGDGTPAAADFMAWRALLWGLIWLVAGVGIGKWLGLAAARFKLQAAVRELRRAAGPAKRDPQRPSVPCGVGGSSRS